MSKKPMLLSTSSPARVMPTKPYKPTKSVLFNALLFTCHLYGCEDISHSKQVITCTRDGKRYTIITTGKTTCIDVLVAIGLIPSGKPKPPRKQNMSEPSYNKAKSKEKGVKRAA